MHNPVEDSRNPLTLMFDDEYEQGGEWEACTPKANCPVVTVSRSCGSDGGRIAELLAEFLTVPCFGYSMVNGIIQVTRTTRIVINQLDERAPDPLEDWLRGLFNQEESTQEGYCKQLLKATLAIAERGGVIVGRAAHVLLAENPKVFRVRIVGSLPVCTKRISERKKLSQKEAEKMVLRVDNERALFEKGIHKRHPTSRTDYDLVINSDDIDMHTVVDIIVFAMEKMGFYVPGTDTIRQQQL